MQSSTDFAACGRATSGSITVTLTLIFLVIFSLVVSILEAAASAAARSYSKFALFSACESVLGGYYGPLYDDYGIFALDTGFGESRSDISALESEILSYIDDCGIGMKVEELKVTERKSLTDDRGVAFLNQVCDAQKAESAQKLAESLLENLQIISSAEEVGGLFKRRIELESRFEIFDRYTLELMRIIDGIDLTASVSEQGYAVLPRFVKKLLLGDMNYGAVGINNAELYSAVCGYYVSPFDYLSEMKALNMNYCILSAEEEKALYELEIVREEAERLRAKLLSEEGEIDSVKKAEADGETKEDNSVRLALLKGQIEELEKRIHTLSENRQNLNIEYENVKNRLLELISECIEKEQEALVVLEKVRTQQELLAPIADAFEQTATAALAVSSFCKAAGIGDPSELITGSIETMKAYLGQISISSVPNYAAMAEELKANNEILAAVYDEIGSMNISMDASAKAESKMQEVSYRYLCFDYSSFKSASSRKEALKTEGLSEISVRVLEYLLPSSVTISNLILDESLLPGRAMGPVKDASLEENNSEAGQGIQEEKHDSADLPFLPASEAISGRTDILLSLGSEVMSKRAALVMYAGDRFESFLSYKNKGDTALEYEREYLVFGNASDSVNLCSVAGSLFALRLLSSGIYTFSDSESNARAAELASLTVGFAGVPFITAAAKYLILSALAFEQAAVETSALLQGKQVPLLTNRSSFCISIPEIPVFTKEKLLTKASAFSGMGAGLKYDGYILLFLLLEDEFELEGRIMDLIQENIRYRYNERFMLANCISEFKAEAEFGFPARYMKLSKNAGSKKHIVEYRIKSEYRAKYN